VKEVESDLGRLVVAGSTDAKATGTTDSAEVCSNAIAGVVLGDDAWVNLL